MRRFTVLSVCCLLLALTPNGVAHFRLLEPASWLQESELGDPQWSPPCGGTLTDPGRPTGAVTKVEGGEKLHIRIREMAFHPGFYRVALAVNSRDELPPDPEATSEAGPTGPRSVSGAIHYPPSAPVLADGLFMHTAAFDKEQEANVQIPNINCAKCTLQVIEFMAAHGRNKDGDYTYHHCAVLQIHANPSQPIDTRFPAKK
ncbi:MAG TPA: SCE4755 family polysaccharide monooxygenase-like protein [Bryobacteraceae bacterium]|nr:SCE4755 family polysaccharide monooxygenase-like protein [Bryobacteraceae bacterium]